MLTVDIKKLAGGCLLLLLPALPAFSAADNLSVGLGYPYISLKYDMPVLSAEGRFVTGSGVQAYAGRGYWNFHRSDKLTGFAGLEGGYIKFDALDIKGTGSEWAAFIGGEYSVTEKVSLLMDFAPTLISLKSGGQSAGGLQYVVNLGLYWHFGEARSGAEPKRPARGADRGRNAGKNAEPAPTGKPPARKPGL